MRSLLVFGTGPDRLQSLAMSDAPSSYELLMHTVTITCALSHLSDSSHSLNYEIIECLNLSGDSLESTAKL